MVAGTMQTDPRSGGVKRSSGVNVLPAVAEGQWVEHGKPLLSCFFNLLLSLMISMWAHHQKFSCRFIPNTTVWAQIRDDSNAELDWLLIGYEGSSKTNMTVVDKGNGGMEAVSSKLPPGIPVFGGVRLSTGKFVHFLYIDEDCPAMKRGRTLMYKNGT